MTATSRWSAGPGAPSLLLDLLTAEGWTAEPDASGSTTCASPDGTLALAFGPETPAYHCGGPLWTVSYTPAAAPDPAPCGDCGTNHSARRWAAMFGDEVPVEAIAAFLTDLICPEGLDPHRADQYPAESSEPAS